MHRIQQLNGLCGIDIGCTNIKMAAFTTSFVAQQSVPSGDDMTKEELIEIVSKFYTSFNYKFKGLGIAFSGCTIDNCSVCDTSLQCLRDLSVHDFSHLHCKKIALINDANASALAGLLEYPDSDVLLGITNGTGIGCGIVINGKLFTGSTGLAGQIYGNPVISPEGDVIKNGKICSGSKVLKKIKNDIDGNRKIEVIHQAANYLGMEIVSLIHSYNPDIVYLSGGGFNFPDYLETLNSFIYRYTYPNFLENLKIVRSNFSSYAGCFGAMKYLLVK